MSFAPVEIVEATVWRQLSIVPADMPLLTPRQRLR